MCSAKGHTDSAAIIYFSCSSVRLSAKTQHASFIPFTYFPPVVPNRAPFSVSSTHSIFPVSLYIALGKLDLTLWTMSSAIHTSAIPCFGVDARAIFVILSSFLDRFPSQGLSLLPNCYLNQLASLLHLCQLANPVSTLLHWDKCTHSDSSFKIKSGF